MLIKYWKKKTFFSLFLYVAGTKLSLKCLKMSPGTTKIQNVPYFL